MSGTKQASLSTLRTADVRIRRTVTNIVERLRRVPWPRGVAPSSTAPTTAIVSVNHNSLEHVAHLLFSVFRVLDPAPQREIVIIDNRSSDGSAEYLEAFARRGLIQLVRNAGPPYHGPGLNRGMNVLARRQRDPSQRVDYVWILDSDVIVLRPDALAVAVEGLRKASGALAGQLQHDQPGLLPEGYAHVSANLMDPSRVWRRGVSPFLEHGAPGAMMQRALRRQGEAIVDFPFYASGYLLHLGRGTLGSIAKRGDRRNRYYDWAVNLTSAPPEGDPNAYHFHGNPDGSRVFARFVELFDAEVPTLSPEALVDACQRPERVNV
jgi:hypothetical protein